MTRRAFIGTLAGGLLAAPLAAEAQQAGRVYRIGFLSLSSAGDYATYVQAFRQELRDLGYEDGKNVSIEYRWAEGRDERLAMLAAELVRLNPDVLVTHAIPGIRAAQHATSTIPIVMGTSSDPVRLGLVKSLAKPGGNTTGVSTQLIDLSAKRLELLGQAVPTLRQVAILSNPANATARETLNETELAARQLGVRVQTFEVVKDPTALDGVFRAIVRAKPDALIVIPDPLVLSHISRIVEFTTRNRLPSLIGEKRFVAAGALMSYGGDFVEGWRLAARYVDRILKGANPADLPIEQPTKFELVINLKTAKALGLTIPPSLLQRADQVIE